MVNQIGLSQPCATCGRCNTVDFPFAHFFEPLRCVSRYAPGTVVCTEGQYANAVYIICRGQANVVLTSARGKSAVLRTCTPGDLIGVADVLLSKPVLTRTVALTVCDVSHIPASHFRDILREKSGALTAITRMLSEQIRGQYARETTVYLTASIQARFMDLLRQLSGKGRRTSRGVEIPFPYTQLELAEHLSCARETIARLLVRLTRDGVVQRRGAKLILVRDFEKRLPGLMKAA